MLKGNLLNSWFALLIIAVATFAAYSNSFDVPFYLDDFGSIVNNPSFKGSVSIYSLLSDYGLRTLGYLSFYIDYTFYKQIPTGYHYTNVTIHLISGFVIFLFVKKLFELAYPSSSSLARYACALLASLLFITHPIQTQAVTYIVQRLASLAALFYLLSVCSYLYARSSKSGLKQNLLFSVAVLSVFCAFFTKQNTVTLVLVILLIEWMFFAKRTANKLLAIIGSLASILLLLFVFLPTAPFIHQLDAISRETIEISRLDYFSSQLCILWMYVGKLIWPTTLHLDYGLKVEQFGLFTVVVSAIAHCAVLIITFILRRSLPLLFFGIAFFYIAHLIESSIFPITDLVFEHRAYLPNVGLFIALSSVVYAIGSKLERRKVSFLLLPVAGGLLIGLTLLTIARNEQWRDPAEFYENELRYNPNNVRTIHNYAEYSGRIGDLEKAESLIKRMYEVPGGKIDGAMVNTHIVLLMSQGKFRDAASLGRRLLEQEALHPRTRVYVLSNLGIIYTTVGKYALADKYFREAYPSGAMTIKGLNAYAFSLIKNGYPLKAIEVIDDIVKINPNSKNAEALRSLAMGNTPRVRDDVQP